MHISSGSQLNPWISMWTKPRETIQDIVNSNPIYFVVPLGMLAGIGRALDNAVSRNMGDRFDLHTIFLACILGGAIMGLLALYLGSLLLRPTGQWLGGKATAENIRAALAWSAVPSIWALFLWIPEIAIFGKGLFMSEIPEMEESAWMAWTLLAFGIVEITIGIWSLVVFVKSLSQVQGFSSWKALANALLATALLFAIFAAAAGAFALIEAL